MYTCILTSELNGCLHVSQTPDPRFFRNSQNALGLLAVPIEVLREQAAENVRQAHINTPVLVPSSKLYCEDYAALFYSVIVSWWRNLKD